MGLIDLNGEMGRIDGGVGVAINEPYFEIEAWPNDELVVEGPLSKKASRAASHVLDRIDGEPAKIKISKSFPEHVGLGSGTQVGIATAAAVLKINGISMSVPAIAQVIGRGGTSGIGTAAFDRGGFILDGGHDFQEKRDFLPSSASSVSPPPVLSRFDFPDWNIMVAVPDGHGAHGSDEQTIFEEECPIPAKEVEKLSRIILMKLLPSIANTDFELFRESIQEIQHIGFKRRELDRQPESKKIIQDMHSRGHAVGMSSFGPAVYIISPKNIDKDYLPGKIYETTANNSGAVMKYSP